MFTLFQRNGNVYLPRFIFNAVAAFFSLNTTKFCRHKTFTRFLISCNFPDWERDSQIEDFDWMLYAIAMRADYASETL